NVTIRRSLFKGNIAGSKGGAIYVTLTNTTIVNNTVYGNQADYGGGIATYNAPASIINTILWQNSATTSGSQYYHTGSLSPSYTYCDIEGNSSGTGNIDADPLFVNVNLSNFNLPEGSPCIDLGDPDLDGDGIDYSLDTDDQDIDGTRMDIGAFAFIGPDTVAPTIAITIPNGGESYGTGARVAFEWAAADDRSLQWTKAHISYDAGVTYSQIDSIFGNPGGMYWDVPTDTITDLMRLKVEVAD
ncbi:uncharacterized protein METZ01_LOCUS477396, partial [marine metagenome]